MCIDVTSSESSNRRQRWKENNRHFVGFSNCHFGAEICTAEGRVESSWVDREFATDVLEDKRCGSWIIITEKSECGAPIGQEIPSS